MEGSQPTVLIAGASGLVGNAALRQFLLEGWNVITLSRRKPDVDGNNEHFQHLHVDLLDEKSCKILHSIRNVRYIVFAAVQESTEQLFQGWLDPLQMELNRKLLVNLLEPLLAVSEVRHISLLQGSRAYGFHLHPVPESKVEGERI